jgi:hypothetical protein
MNCFVQCIRADSRTINRVELCGWEFPRRVGFGCGLGRVVFRHGTAQVNSRLASLLSNYCAEFASTHSNGRMKIELVSTRPYLR